MRRRTPKDRYNYNRRRQLNNLDKFIEHEIEWAELLVKWYASKKIDIPDDEYRGCAFFINKEYRNKPGSLTLLYKVCNQCYRELPEVTKENAFDVLRYRFRLYAKALEKWGK
jgi:hypothetical protein